MSDRIEIFGSNTHILDLSSLLTTWRKQYKFTQQEVADMLGISLRTVIRYEKGETIPSLKRYMEITNKLGNSKETPCQRLSEKKVFPGVTKLLYPSDMPSVSNNQMEEMILLPVIKSDFDLVTINAKYPLEWTSIFYYPLRKEDFEDIGEINKDNPPFGYTLDGEGFESFGIPEGSILIINPNIPFSNGDLCLLSYDSTFLPRWVVSKGDNFELYPGCNGPFNISEDYMKDTNLVLNYGKAVKVIGIQKIKSFFKQR